MAEPGGEEPRAAARVRQVGAAPRQGDRLVPAAQPLLPQPSAAVAPRGLSMPTLCPAGSVGSPAAHPAPWLPARSKTCVASFRTETDPAAADAGTQGTPSPTVSLRAPGPGRGIPAPAPRASRDALGRVGAKGGPSLVSWRRWWWSGGLWGARGARALPGAPCHASPAPWPPPQLSKRAASYRKAFGELAERDALLGCFSCAWQREVPYHGRLYISSQHICFHASLLLKDIKVGWRWARAGGSGGGHGQQLGTC